MNEPLTKDEMIEKLAELEHQQWEKWSKDLFSQLEQVYSCIEKGDLKQAKRILINMSRKWKNNWKPYSILDEQTKEFDREWARKAYAVFEEGKRR